jgi:acetolactate synthase-1/2/3 large subunit
MRVADYIAEFVYRLGVHEVFMVSGGGMMFLTDGIAKHPHLRAICNHHEQASAMAAVSYAKYTGNIGVAYFTTGCGGTNAITGLLDAWQDNIACLFISGQAKRKETVRNSGLKLRQFGVQEADIISIVQPVTKYAVMVNEPEEIAYHLERAVHLAKSGRPGPVWIEVPLDVQAAPIEPNNLKRYSEEEAREDRMGYKQEPTAEELQRVYELLATAKRPIIIAGQGIRLGKAIKEFREFVESSQIPVVSSRLGLDLLPTDSPLFVGRIGNKGDRAGNFAVQNADLVLSLGCRLSVSTTGHEYSDFAREAKIVVVDIDPVEHSKRTVRIDFFINAEVQSFLKGMIYLTSTKPAGSEGWRLRCREWKTKYPVCLPEFAESPGINLYYFSDQLCRSLAEDAVLVGNAGSVDYVMAQALRVKEQQRYITSGAQGEMGYTLPACIGVCFARGKREVIGVTGDGALQMNIQELQTIVHHDLPVKLFIWNNSGYMCIRTTQNRYFDGRLIGADSTSGVSFPALKKIADAYGIQYFRAPDSKTLTNVIREILAYPKAAICEVMCLHQQDILTVASVTKPDGRMVSRPLEDMYPFLDRQEFLENMIVGPREE